MLGNSSAYYQKSDVKREISTDDAPEAVRRVDWDQCTLIMGEQVTARTPEAGDADATLAALKELLVRVRIDETVPLYMAAIDGRLLYVSSGYEALIQKISLLSDLPSDAEPSLPIGLRSVIAEVERTAASVGIEEKIRVGGQIRHFRSRHFPVVRDGKVIAVGGTYLDFTREVESLEQAKAAQERFRDFARASSDWFWECDREMCLTMLSDRLTALLGIPAANFIGKRFEDIGGVHELDDGSVPMRQAQTSNRPFRDQLFGMRNREGELLVFHLSGVPVFDIATGEFQGYRGAGMDITSRIRSEQQAEEIKRSLENLLEELTNKNMQLDLASARAEEALRVKNEFLAAMSHELRTPLNAILGFAEAMNLEMFGNINAQYKSYSNDILSAGNHLLGLINDVLDVAVLENDRIKLDLEPVSLRLVIQRAFNLVHIRAEKKQLDVSKVTIHGDWTLQADLRRVTQVFVNLFSNAVKFTPDHGVIGVDVALLAGHRLAVTIWDTGIGIPEDKQEIVFEKFQQGVDNIYSRTEEGTGLGLHISRHLAQLMGGDITLESVVGEGSRFTVVMPLYVREETGVVI